MQNSAPAPPGGAVGRQAVAFRIKGDMAAFYRVSFYGAQDTLYDQNGRHYFEKCFIQGSIDFIFGDGQSLYKVCQTFNYEVEGLPTLETVLFLTVFLIRGYLDFVITKYEETCSNLMELGMVTVDLAMNLCMLFCMPCIFWGWVPWDFCDDFQSQSPFSSSLSHGSMKKFNVISKF